VDLESKSRGSESRFAAYVEAITSVLGHADRASPFRSYCAGLLLPRVCNPGGCGPPISHCITSWRTPIGPTRLFSRRWVLSEFAPSKNNLGPIAGKV
jgi:hypothetical protein